MIEWEDEEAIFTTYHEVSKKHSDGDLADRGHVQSRLLLDGGPVKVPMGGEIDARGPVADQLGRDLVRLRGHTGDDDVAEREALLEAPAFLVLDLVALLLDTLAAGEELHAGDVDGIHGGAVVGEESGERAAVDLGAVDDRDGLAKEPVARGEDGVVDLEVLEDLDNGQRGAGQDGLLAVLRRVEEADVVVHVVQVLVAHALDVLAKVDSLLDVLVVVRVLREDGVVDDHAVDVLIIVGLHDLLLQGFLLDVSQVEVEATFCFQNLVSVKVFFLSL